mgnify:CR=1 FL=1
MLEEAKLNSDKRRDGKNKSERLRYYGNFTQHKEEVNGMFSPPPLIKF